MDNQRCHAAALAEPLSRNSQKGSPSTPPFPRTPFSPCCLLPALTRKKEIQKLWLLWGRPVAFNLPRSFGDVAKSGIEAIEAALAAGLCLLVSVRRVSGQRYSAFESGDLRVLAPLDVHKYAFGCESCADRLG